MDEAKPFDILKREVWEAFKHVKVNQGAAGVDGQSTAEFEGSYENFVTGFWVSGQHRAEVWGRPAALAIVKDGSLLIADDTGGTIWRVSYTGPKSQASDRETTTTGAPQR